MERKTKYDPKASYYFAGGLETLDIIKAKLTPEQYIGFLLGNSIKYHCRFNWKHAGTGRIRDMVKSKVYLKELVEFMEKQDEPNT